jgi:hypothetical protein
LALPCALASLSFAGALQGQVRGDAPIAPAATIGPVTDAATLSVLGMASLPDGSGGALNQRNDLWMGATQPIGHLGRFRFSALGSGNWKFRDGVAGDASAQGIVSMRARARFGQQRIWSAVSYGQASLDGSAGAALLGTPTALAAGGYDTRGADTTVSRRIDVGRIGRAEAGMVTNVSGVEFAFGMSVERATRVTTQTITIDEPSVIASLPSSAPGRVVSSRTVRTLQRRDVATGIASAGFNTGATTWLLSVTSPVATWITSDALAPRPQSVPTVASVAVVQPVTGWLSLVGAAATSPATVGGAAMRDDVSNRRHANFAPVIALGLRFSRLPGRGGDGTPGGILSFETRELGAVDSISLVQGAITRDGTDTDTLRVVLLIDAPRAESVEIMGDATSWTVTQMRRHPNGRWRAELKLSPGMHRITVRADGGKWVAPPGVPVSSDDYGTPVGMLLVKGKSR